MRRFAAALGLTALACLLLVVLPAAQQDTPERLRLAWISEEANGSYTLAWADYDADGDPDLAIGSKWGPGRNQLYRNDRGVLVLAWTAEDEDATESHGLDWGDWDGDGDPDLAVGNDFNQPNLVYTNEGGDLELTWISLEAEGTMGVAWADWDGDGDLDLAAVNAEQPNRLYENTGGDLVATWESEEWDRSEGLAWADWDGDGDPDLTVANYALQPNRIYENTEDGLLLAWTSEEMDSSLCVAWADWDGDGDLDLAVGNAGEGQNEPNRVYENTGGDLALAWTSDEEDTTVGVAWADVDGDGDLDLACARKGPNRLYENLTVQEDEAGAVPAREGERMERHGFRHDPMEFVEESDSLPAAAVRATVLEQPKAGDDEKLEAYFREVFAEQDADGHLKQEHHEGARATAEKLLGLLDMGCSPDRPELQKALDALEASIADLPPDKGIGCRELAVLFLAGRTDHPSIKPSLERLARDTVDGLGEGDPGTPMAQLIALWLGRDLTDVGDAIEAIFRWLEEAVEPPGCSKQLGLCEPWGLIDMAGLVDHPAAERITRTLVPMLLRFQKEDGGWGEGWWIGGEKHSTIYALRAVAKYGLLGELRDLPPLPADWEVVDSIPAPGEEPRNLTFLDGELWVLDTRTWSAIRASTDDGSILETVLIERQPGMNHFGFGTGEGTFFISAFGEKEKRTDAVYEVDAKTGEARRRLDLPSTGDGTGNARVGSKLLVADGWAGGAMVVDLDDPDAEIERVRLAAGMPDLLAAHGDEIWGVDWFTPTLVKTNLEGELLDWGERPFGFSPVAWDGTNLWALDSTTKRVCRIEKAW